MSIFGPSRRALPLLAVAILASGIAAADTIDVTGLGTGEGSAATPAVDFYIDEDVNAKLTNTSIQFAGLLDISVTDTSGTYDRTTMCVQLLTNISYGVYDTIIYQPAAFSPPTGPELEQVAWLLDSYDVSGISALDAAALQVAIWKITEDGLVTSSNLSSDLKWNSGVVQEMAKPDQNTAKVFTQAATYLTAAVGESSNKADVYYNWETDGTVVQMLEGPTYPTGPQGQTPESSTFVLAGVALLAFGHATRRRLGRG